MTNDPQHDKKEEEEQVELPEDVEKLFELEKIEEKLARKRKDVKKNIDTQLSPGSRPTPETETGNSVNGSAPATCELTYRCHG